MVTQPSDGGVFEHLVGLVAALRERGHRVAVAGPVEHEAARLDADIHQLELVRPVSPRQDGPALARYARIVRAVRPDVIHAHSSKAGALARIGRVAHPRTPVVYTPHGFAFNGYFESERERSAYRAVERALAPLASRVLCVCEAERRLAASVGPAGRTRTVYNAVAEHVPGPGHPDLVAARERGPVVGAVSQLRPGKGVETLVDAMPALLARHPAASVAVAGSGPLRAEVEAQARSLGFGDSLLLLGQTDGPGPVLDGQRPVREPLVGRVVPPVHAGGHVGLGPGRGHRRRRGGGGRPGRADRAACARPRPGRAGRRPGPAAGRPRRRGPAGRRGAERCAPASRSSGWSTADRGVRRADGAQRRRVQKPTRSRSSFNFGLNARRLRPP